MNVSTGVNRTDSNVSNSDMDIPEATATDDAAGGSEDDKAADAAVTTITIDDGEDEDSSSPTSAGGSDGSIRKLRMMSRQPSRAQHSKDA
jgi:hypothetical protein